MTEQIVECCICMDDIIGSKNKTTTDCGHIFHCSCLMKNTAHNGYGCPYCRTVMAEVPDEDEDEDEDEDDYEHEHEYDEDDEEMFDDNVLTSFRMFQQRNSGDNIEEEPEIEDEEAEEERVEIPSPQMISEILVRQGVTMEDVIKCLLSEHEEYEDYPTIERKADEMFGRMRIIISNYVRDHSQ